MTENPKALEYNQQAEKVIQSIIEQIEAGASNWEMPWTKGILPALNRCTGNYYTSTNLWMLWEQCKSNNNNYSQNHWATFKQWQRLGAKVKTGEKGIRIAIFVPKKAKNKEQLELIKNNSDELNFDRNLFYLNYPKVFNADQVENWFDDQPDLFGNTATPLERIEMFIEATGAKIEHGGDRAYYSPSKDYIQMPYKATFKGGDRYSAIEAYYSTLFHEVLHWTAHHSRCNRKIGYPKDSAIYAFEELVAELGSAILSTHFHQRIKPREEHSQYLNSWLRVLKHDFSFFHQAQNQALSAVSWLFKKNKILSYDIQSRKSYPPDDERVKKWEELWG